MSPITEAMKPSRNSDRQSCASSGELLPKNGTAFATESPTTFVSSRPTSFGSSRRAGITGKITGNFAKFGPPPRFSCLISLRSNSLRNGTGNFQTRIREILSRNREFPPGGSFIQPPCPSFLRSRSLRRCPLHTKSGQTRRGVAASALCQQRLRNSGCEPAQQTECLFDHLIGAGKERWRYHSALDSSALDCPPCG